MQERIPEGIELDVVMDQSVYVREAIKALVHEGALGAIFVLAVVGVAFVASLALYPFLGQELFPQVDAGQIVMTVRVPTGTRLEATERSIVEIENALKELIKPDDLGMVISEQGVVPDWSAAYTPNSGPQDAVLKIQLTEHRSLSAQQYADALREKLNERFPGLEFAFNTGGMVSAALNYGALSPIDVQIFGKITENSRDFSRQLWEAARSVPGAADVRINQRFDYPQLNIVVNRAKCADLGLTQENVIQNVVTCLNSSIQFARNFWIDPVSGNQYWVGVQYDETADDSIDDLLNVPITGANSSSPVLLRNVAEIRRRSAPAEIQHVNFSPVINVYANASGRDVGAVASDIEDDDRSRIVRASRSADDADTARGDDGPAPRPPPTREWSPKAHHRSCPGTTQRFLDHYLCNTKPRPRSRRLSNRPSHRSHGMTLRRVPRPFRKPPPLDPSCVAPPVTPRHALLVNPFYPKDPHASFGKHVLTPSLAISCLYKRSNPLWHLLIRHGLTARVWRPLVEITRRRHLLFRKRLERRAAEPAATSGVVLPAGV